MKIIIDEKYNRWYSHPYKKAIEECLAVLPPETYSGIGSIVVTPHIADPDARKNNAMACYHPPYKGQLAWIEIWPKNFSKGDFFCNVFRVSSMTRRAHIPHCLYHEIGHHLARMKGYTGERAEKEAETYALKFDREYNTPKYFLKIIFSPVLILYGIYSYMSVCFLPKYFPFLLTKSFKKRMGKLYKFYVVEQKNNG